MHSTAVQNASQNSLHEQVRETFGSALDRLARAYQPDAEARRDLL
jgi:hypothetical protein